MEPPSYIVLRFSALGDVALSLPFLYQAAYCYPDRRFTFVTTPFHSHILLDPPPNVRVVTFDTRHQGGFKGCIQLAHRLHKLEPMATILDLHDVLRTRIISSTLKVLGHTVYTIRKPRRERARLVQRPPKDQVPRELYVPPMTQVYCEVYRRCGLTKVQEGFSPFLDSSAKRSPILGIAPYAKHPSKVLPTERLRELITLIHRYFPHYTILLYSAPGEERQRSEALSNEFPGFVSCTRASSITEELREISTLSAMISMDSANQHLAAWMGTPVVSIWGATHPAAGFIPWHGSEEDCLGIPLPCRPCSIYGQKPCHRGDLACMYRLKLSKVIDRLHPYLD